MKVNLDATAIVMTVLGLLIGIISFFLSNIYKEFKECKKDFEHFKQKTIEDQGKLKGLIELVEKEQRLKYEQIQTNTQLEIKHLAENINNLTTTVHQLITLKEKNHD